MIKLSQVHKDVFKTLISRKEFPGFVDFLKVQRNNIAIIEWARLDSLDPQLAIKKAKFEGKMEMLKEILMAFETVGRTREEDDGTEES